MEQLALSFASREECLRRIFEEAVGRPVRMVVTDNSSSFLAVRSGVEALHLRVHRMFLDAGDEVIGEISRFIRRRGGGTPLVREFVRLNRHRMKTAVERKVRVATRGRVYDLEEIFNSLNREYFDGKVEASITWGTVGGRRWVRKRTLGSYNAESKSIRINPILDSRQTPRYYLEFVVYHEMLHAYMGVRTQNGRRLHHFKEFREMERRFASYDKVLAWEGKG